MLDKLLVLQGIDREIDNLEEQKKRMAERKEKADLLIQLEKLQSQVKQFNEELKKARLEQDKAEGEIQLIESKISKETGRLYSGKVTSPKELSGIQQEIQSLARKKEDLENKLLTIMEEVSDREKMAAHYQKKADEISKNLERLDSVIRNQSDRINKEVAVLKSQRKNQSAEIDENLLSEYEQLRARHQGVGIVQLADGVCQACFVELPAVEIDRMEPGKKNYCPFCGRLVKF